jgi:hypothetical protein
MRRVNASQATSRPCMSRVIPFAQLVSFTGAIGWPGVYFQRRAEYTTQARCERA